MRRSRLSLPWARGAWLGGVISAALWLAPPAGAEEAVSGAALRAVFGAASARVPSVEKAPVVDGRLNEAAWRRAAPLWLHYADERVEGTPIEGTWAKVLRHGGALYVGLRASGPVKLARAEGVDEERIFQDSFLGLAWKTKKSAYLFLINARGAIYHARRAAAGAPWEAAWNPEHAEAKAARAEGGWSAEWKLPLKLLAGREGKWPALRRVDFLRRHWIYHAPEQPGLKMLRSFHAWKTRPPAAAERLTKKVDIFADEDFGVLYFPRADLSMAAKAREKLRAAERVLRDQQAKAVSKRKKRPEGFAFSREELARFYPGAPVLFVPLVKAPPRIDGDPGDEAWAAASPEPLGFLSSAILGKPRRNRTFVRALCDREHLYFLFVCKEDQPEAIRATPGPADSGGLWREDHCAVLLDVNRGLDEGADGYVQLTVNAAGRLAHSRRRADPSWDPRRLKCAARIWPKRRQWVVEMKIAFRDLGLEPGRFSKIWGANFLRSRTPGRGVWIDRQQTKDPAYLNFDFAWRGNAGDSPHRPDRFGILYLQAGSALPDKLYEALKKRGGGAAVAGRRRWRAPSARPLPAPPERIVRPRFAEAPAAKIKDGKAEITFRAAGETDAAVAVYDATGAAVRHLAAGRLGRRAPRPLRSFAQRQKMDWDFRDDRGRAVPPGTYSVRVGLGLRPVLERFLFRNPNGLREVQALSVDAQGNIYVVQSDHKVWFHAPLLLVFNREGQYLRQLIPYSGRLSDEKLSAARRIRLPSGRRIPALFHGIYQVFAPAQAWFGPQRFAVDGDGSVVLANGLLRTETRFPKRLLRIAPGGGLGARYLGPVLGPRASMRGPSTIALSPDGRFAYLAGLHGGGNRTGAPARMRRAVPLLAHHVVYRLDLKDPAANRRTAEGFPVPFLGELGVPGSDEKHFRYPRGVAVDAKGNLYVADSGNDRILGFTPEKRCLGALPVPHPEQVEVHPKTGALYVLSVSLRRCELLRFSSLNAARASASIELEGRRWARMALDASRAKARLWVVGKKRRDRWGPREVLAVDEAKDGFENRGTLIADREYERLQLRFGLPSMIDSRIGPGGKRAIVWGVAVDTETGRRAGTGVPIRQRGRDGLLYEKVRGRAQGIRRFDAKGRERPFENTKDGVLRGPRGTLEFDVGPGGRVYLLKRTGVDLYDAAGRLAVKDFIKIPQALGTSNGVNACMHVDRAGSVYLAATMKPPEREIPRALQGRLPAVERRPSLPFVYRHLYGSVVKFSPKGGRVTLDKKGAWAWGQFYSGKLRCRAEGVEWVHFGMSPLRYRNVQQLPCTCEAAHFDVDAFGRVFLPDALRFSVEVLDTNGNTLGRFGRYGNMDDPPVREGGQEHPPLAWPIVVSVRGEHLFIADRLNKQIVKLRLEYAVEKRVRLSVSGRAKGTGRGGIRRSP